VTRPPSSGKPGARAALAASERRFRTLVEHSSDAILLLDAAGTVLYASQSLHRVLGYEPEERIGRSVFELVHPDDVSRVQQVFAATLQHPGEVYTAEVRARHRDGSWRHIDGLGVNRLDDPAVRAVVVNLRDVTERRAAEAALARSEARTRELVGSALDAVITMDHAGRVVEWNPAAERMFGYARAEAVGRPLAELVIPPALRERHRTGLARYLATGEGPILGRRLELTGVRADGREFPVELSVTRVGATEPPEFTAFVRDITERRHAERVQSATYRIAEAALAASDLQDLFRSIHETVAELMPAENFYLALYDPVADLVSFPYFRDERDVPEPPRPPGRGLTEYVLRSGQAVLATQEYFDELVARGEVELIGAPSLDWLGVPLRGREGTIGVLVVQSYTEGVRYGPEEQRLLEFVSAQAAQAIERKRAEAERAASEVKYRLLFEANPEAMWVYDAETFRFLAVNEAAVRRYGHSRTELLAMTVKDIRLPADHVRIEAALRAATDQPARFEGVRHRRRDGTEIETELLVHAIEFEGRPGRLVLTRDVTRQRRLEEELRQAQRIEAVGRLAGGVAHDFNNLLTAILGYTQLVLREMGPDDANRADVEEIKRAGDRAAALTQQLLAFSRRQVLQPRVIDVNALVADMEKMLRRLIGEDIDLVADLGHEVGRVRADAGQLEQVILNLALNARDAMPRGGRLTIETADVELAEHAVAGVPIAPGRYVQLRVSDTGVGMDAATRARVFEPFFTTKATGRGTGLGLATVYGIVKQSDGYIVADSEPDRGTTFAVYLPRIGDLPAPAPQRPLPEARGTETVLLVEDEDAVRSLARRTLETMGYRVLEASGGPEALALTRRHAGPIDLLLTDVVMPEMSGSALAEQLVAARPGLPVLFMTGYTDDAVLRHGVSEAGVALLQKPFEPQGLALKVRAVLDGAAARREA
jgi:PAS domain S-box-containing protein